MINTPLGNAIYNFLDPVIVPTRKPKLLYNYIKKNYDTLQKIVTKYHIPYKMKIILCLNFMTNDFDLLLSTEFVVTYWPYNKHKLTNLLALRSQRLLIKHKYMLIYIPTFIKLNIKISIVNNIITMMSITDFIDCYDIMYSNNMEINLSIIFSYFTYKTFKYYIKLIYKININIKLAVKARYWRSNLYITYVDTDITTIPHATMRLSDDRIANMLYDTGNFILVDGTYIVKISDLVRV